MTDRGGRRGSPGPETGLSLIELVIALIVLAVGILALATTVPLMMQSETSEDAEQLVREGRGCAETLIALEEDDALTPGDGGACSASAPGEDPDAWIDQDAADSAGLAGDLARFCSVDTLEVDCEEADLTGESGTVPTYRFRIEPVGATFEPIELHFPREGDDD